MFAYCMELSAIISYYYMYIGVPTQHNNNYMIIPLSVHNLIPVICVICTTLTFKPDNKISTTTSQAFNSMEECYYYWYFVQFSLSNV